MNSVVLIGRLTRDPETRYTSGTQMAVCTFTVAIDRPGRQGEEKKTDFPRVTVFGKQAGILIVLPSGLLERLRAKPSPGTSTAVATR